MAADVHEYSRLIAHAEDLTITQLRSHRAEIVDPAITQHRGRIANTAGDSVLAEFPCIEDAVACSVAIQTTLLEVNKEVDPTESIRFRIGLHLDEVVDIDGDLLGHGVNIAARLEALATPGGILISEHACPQASDGSMFGFCQLGPRKLKNLAEPIVVYEIVFRV
ncbi:MAG: adenylate cyclase [Gammaproteobacteria bacterium]|jgi:adenylate cyclase